jgi:hypothetical protein
MRRIRASSDAMLAILHLLGTFVANLFKLRRRLEVENLFLLHQLNIARAFLLLISSAVSTMAEAQCEK